LLVILQTTNLIALATLIFDVLSVFLTQNVTGSSRSLLQWFFRDGQSVFLIASLMGFA